MKRNHIIILLTLLVLLLAPAAALAIIAPHDGSNGYRCSVCHNAHSKLGATGFNNMCTTCHNPNDPKGGAKPFYQTDAANPYNTILNGYSGNITPTKIYQTSHNWTGTDKNTAAGATPPTSAAMNATGTIKGLLLCARCHSVHGARESAINSAPFLRGLNNNDQMCLDCHKIRNTNSHMTGSHPVNVNYTSMAKLNTTGLNTTPINANPANPTSAMKLVNGAVQCSTCHAIHYSDSRSGTTDTALAYNQLSTSRGHLLRTDARGKTAEDINICTNCHAGKKAHNGSNQNIQCNDCHSGHVEYDPQAVSAEEKKPNLFVLRRFMNVSTAAGRNTKIRTFYRYTGSQKEFYRGPAPADGALGVCQACHYDKETFKSGHYVNPADPSLGIKDERKQCATCHDHKGNFGCSSCHGFPPKENARGKNGYAVWSTAIPHNRVPYTTFNEHSTPHATHADGTLYKFACIQCHRGNTAHNTGNFQQVFLLTTDNISPVAQYNTGTRNCTTTFCHSNGRATPTYPIVPVTWGENKGSIVNEAGRCTKCHADKNTTDLLSGAHERHAASTGINYSCQNCHAKTLRDKAPFANNSGLTFPSTSHVNGTRNVSYFFSDFANAGLLNKVTDAILPYGGSLTCNTIYCHSNGAGQQSIVVPNWNDETTGKCGTCHGVLGSVESYTTFGMISSGIHFAHLSSTYGPKLVNTGTPNACLRCHSSYSTSGGETRHVDGNFIADQSAGNKCYKCHGGLQQGPLPALADRNLACTKCHPIWGGYSAARIYNSDIASVLAPKQINYSTSGHGKSAAPYNKMDCTECHNRSSAHISYPAVLGDNKRLIAVNYTAARRGGANAICGKCHWAGQSAENKVRFTHVTSVSEARNGTPTMACSRCHNVHGTSNFGMINNSIVFNALSAPVPIVYQSPYTSVGLNKVQKNGPFKFIQTEAPYRGICQVCHTKAIHFKRGVNEAVNGPVSGSNEVFSGAFASHRNFGVDTNCLSCHPHTPPPGSPATFAFYPYGQCDVCHGYPPVARSFVRTSVNYSSAKFEDYTGGGGAHTVAGHVPASAKPGQGWDLCNSCHNEQDHLSVPTYPQVKVSINTGLKFNSTIQLKYSTTRKANGTSQNATCYNVSCHFQRTPPWANP